MRPRRRRQRRPPRHRYDGGGGPQLTCGMMRVVLNIHAKTKNGPIRSIHHSFFTKTSGFLFSAALDDCLLCRAQKMCIWRVSCSSAQLVFSDCFVICSLLDQRTRPPPPPSARRRRQKEAAERAAREAAQRLEAARKAEAERKQVPCRISSYLNLHPAFQFGLLSLQVFVENCVLLRMRSSERQ